MKAAYDGGDGVDAGQAAGVADDVDDSGVPAAGEHYKTMAGDVEDEGLVIQNQWVGHPALVGEHLVEAHPVFKVGGPVHLAGNEHRIVEHQ